MVDEPADSGESGAGGIDPLLAAVGARIAKVRLARDIGVTEAASRAGMNKGHWWRIEAGEHNLSVKVLARVAVALATDMGDLLAGVAVPSAPVVRGPDAQPRGDVARGRKSRPTDGQVAAVAKGSAAARPDPPRSTVRNRRGPADPATGGD